MKVNGRECVCVCLVSCAHLRSLYGYVVGMKDSIDRCADGMAKDGTDDILVGSIEREMPCIKTSCLKEDASYRHCGLL